MRARRLIRGEVPHRRDPALERPGKPIFVDGTHNSTVGQLWEDVQIQPDTYDRLRSTSNSAVTSSRSLSAPKKPEYGLIPKAD
jgi:hypothetical protein